MWPARPNMLINPCIHAPEEKAWKLKPVAPWTPPLPTHLCPARHFTCPAPHSLFYPACLSSAVHAAVLQFGTHSKSLSGSHTRPSLLPDWFSHCPGPLPATTATQLSPVSFMAGMHAGLLWLRIELWESFTGSGRAQHQVSDRMNSWPGKKSQLYGNVAFVCSEVAGCCSWERLTASSERDSGSHWVGKALCLSLTQSRWLQPVHSNVYTEYHYWEVLFRDLFITRLLLLIN